MWPLGPSKNPGYPHTPAYVEETKELKLTFLIQWFDLSAMKMTSSLEISSYKFGWVSSRFINYGSRNNSLKGISFTVIFSLKCIIFCFYAAENSHLGSVKSMSFM